MNEILSLRSAESLSIKDHAKISLGQLAATAFPRRCAALKRSPAVECDSRIDRLIMAFLRNRARVEQDTDFLHSFHQAFWKGEGGSVFSANCDHRFEDVFLNQQQEEFSILDSLWKKGEIDKILEIGCCSGQLLQHLTTHLPGVQTAVGVDLNDTQIKKNAEDTAFDCRIEFVCGDGFEYVLANAKPKTLFVTNGGVLEYFSRRQLDEMISRLSDNAGPSMFFAVEPIAPDHDWSLTRESIPFGEELSFSHNYRDIFESNGFDVIHQRHVDFEQWRWMATIATVGI